MLITLCLYQLSNLPLKHAEKRHVHPSTHIYAGEHKFVKNEKFLVFQENL